MQTFLPYPDFVQSAQCLDLKRCGKQRVEARQIIESILFNKGWVNHPAVKQWRTYPKALCIYGMAVCDEWTKRGYEDNQKSIFLGFLEQIHGEIVMPTWIGQEWFHSRHRARLLGKNPQWYSQFAWKEEPDSDAWTFAVARAA